MRRVPLNCGVRWLLQKVGELPEFGLKGIDARLGLLSYHFESPALGLKILNIVLFLNSQYERAMSAKISVLHNRA